MSISQITDRLAVHQVKVGSLKLSQLKVGHRIAGGFALVLLIAMAIAAIGLSGLKGAGNDLELYATESDITRRLGNVTTDINDLRRTIYRYATTGDAVALNAAKTIRTRLMEELTAVRDREEGGHRETLDRMVGLMGDYSKLMERMEVLRTKRDGLIRETLEPNGAKVRKDLAAIVREISTRSNPEATANAAITETAFYMAELAATRFLNQPSAAGAKETRQMVEDFVAKSDELLTFLRDPALRRQASDAVNLAMDYSGAFDQVATAALESENMIGVVMPKLGTTFSSLAQEMKADQDQNLQVIQAEVLERTAHQINLGMGFTAAALVAAAALSWAIARSIVTPVRAMTSAMTRLAGGDLGVDIPATERQDEIGGMGRAVQVFKDNAIAVERLRAEQVEAEKRAAVQRHQALEEMADDFQDHVSAVVGKVSKAAGDMVGTSHTMADIADRTSSQAAAAAAAAEEASTNVQTVASAAEELSASIAEISRQVCHANATAADAARRAEHTDGIVRSLAEAASRIGEVVGLITDIANQTNLLALNATIEAARAGEAGKGFAVVAGEVKNLATQTAKATGEISGQVNAIQSVTREAVEAIHAISTTINEISHVSTAIASAVEEQQAATHEIARNVEQAAIGTAQVAANVTGVTDAAAEAGRAAGMVLKESEALTTTSGDLRDEAEGFIARVRQG